MCKSCHHKKRKGGGEGKKEAGKKGEKREGGREEGGERGKKRGMEERRRLSVSSGALVTTELEQELPSIK